MEIAIQAVQYMPTLSTQEYLQKSLTLFTNVWPASALASASNVHYVHITQNQVVIPKM